MSKPAYDKADARALLDDRGYTGALIRGQNPALLFEKGVRDRITESYYWKEQCFGLNAATLCDRAAELKFIGGTTGIMGKPTPFLCLAFKMLQLVPEKAIVLEYLNFRGDEEDDEDDDKKDSDGGSSKDENGEEKEEEEANEDGNKKQDLNAAGKLGSFKYLRCLAAFYIRLAWEPVEIYKTLEPLLTDYRKIKRRLKDSFTLTYIDQFVDDLLTKDRICATSLWKLPSRANLEDLELLDPRESPLGDEVDALDEEMGGLEDEKAASEGSYRSRSRSRSRSYDSRSRSRSYDSRDRSRSRSMDSRNWRRTRSRSIDSRDRERRRSRSPDHHRRRRISRSRSRSGSATRRRDDSEGEK